jgi:DNA (cytosine-5)-methyltransferase 1|nr:MAG TPA: Cytosine specific methyltransferase [Bacteriophage sp.]
MKHLGDICKINGAEIEPVDCITGGSPCQDLSIAGKRAGLAGERSGLFMEQVRIVKEMRERDRRNGRTGDMVRPRFLVWENVPGAFSSNGGGDFQAVLEEIIHIAEPTVSVPRFEGKWTKAGAIDGDGWPVAWRTHDAQYWGVPQRRRRISVVADFGGDTAWEILFNRQSVSGHPAESGAAGEDPAAGAESGAGRAGKDTGSVICLKGNAIDRDTAQNGKRYQEDKSYTLDATDRHGVCAGFKLGNSEKARSIGYAEEQAPTLNAECGGNKPAVMAFDTTQITSKQNGSIPDFGKPCHTLNANAHVPCAVLDMNRQIPLTYQKTTGTLSPGAHAGSYNGQDAYNDMLVCGAAVPDVAHTLKAKANCDYRWDSETYPVQNMVVRRLTPMECERLQGFPDGWTDIGEWIDEEGRTHKQADSPRYKALGNSIALPFWYWMFFRMAEHLPEKATLGSLFDGIGGFPLCWESIHGKGMARWASEIEKFPIAVTKLRFPEEA